jgi:hypothetical protein
MPSVEVGVEQQEEAGARGAAKRGVEEEGQGKVEEEEVCATVGYVVKDLAAELYTELLQGWHK